MPSLPQRRGECWPRYRHSSHPPPPPPPLNPPHLHPFVIIALLRFEITSKFIKSNFHPTMPPLRTIKVHPTIDPSPPCPLTVSLNHILAATRGRSCWR